MTGCLAIVMSGCLLTEPVLAEDQAGEDAVSQPRWAGSWQPPEPNRSGWDWVRLTSDEWLKGEIVVMREFEMSFDSDEFGVVKLDWDDVAEILTERSYIFVLQDMRTSYAGTMAMHGDRIRIRKGEEIVEFDRAELLAITPSDYREFNLWSGRATVGVALRSGNTDQSEFTGRANFGRESRRTRLALNYTGAYGSLDSQKNTNSHRGSTTFDYFLTRDLFVTPASFEAFSDEFQNISYRLTPSAGFGYFLIRRSTLEWQTRLTGGYQHSRTDEAFAGDSKTADNGAITLITTVDTELSSRVDLILEYQLQLIVPETEQTSHHSIVTLELELTSVIDLDVSLIWDRIEDPEPDSDGTRPDSDDFRVSVGLAIEF